MPEPTLKRRTQQERKAESEREIIRAAIRIISRQGYQRTTLNEVGKEAGYTGGLISHRFGSKAGLLKAVLTSIGSRFYTDQLGDAIARPSAEDSLNNYIAIYLKEVRVREGHMRALYVIMGEALGGEADVQKEVAELNKNARTGLATIIERGVDAGEFRKDIDPKAAAVLIMGTLRGVVMQYLFDHKALSVNKIIPLIQHNAVCSLK